MRGARREGGSKEMRRAEMVGIMLMKVMEIDDTAREDGDDGEGDCWREQKSWEKKKIK